VSEVAAGIRDDVVLANRIAHRAGLVTAFGHVSSRIPGSDAFVIPSRTSPGLSSAESLLVMDTGGARLEGVGTPNSEFWIHARIYAARPDVQAVAHVHAPGCVVLGQIGETLRPIHNSGAIFGPVPVYDRIGLIRSAELGDEVAGVLGSARAMLLRGHGANLVAGSVRHAAVFACLLEEAARLQLRALSALAGSGRSPRYFSPDEEKLVASQLDAPGPLDRAWEYFAALAQGRLDSAAGANAGAAERI
jgi:ribulose-5-phosphate 4-epimerase/fuculose-1-phosphate aldolase